MLRNSEDVTIKEHALPAKAGSFKLTVSRERLIVGVNQSGGQPVLLVQEVDGASTETVDFEVVETGTSITLCHSFEDATVYLGSYQSEGKLLHLFGARAGRRMGGALSL